MHANSKRSALLPRRLQSHALRRSDHFEAITGATIPMRRRHAAYDVKIFRPNAFFLDIEQFVPQMNALYQTNHEAIIPNVQRSPFLAFQARRRLGDAWRLDHRRFASGQPSMNEFIFAVGQRGSAFVHCLGDGFINEVDDEFVCAANIPSGILGCAIVAVAGANS